MTDSREPRGLNGRAGMWLAILAILAVSLAVGARGAQGPPSPAERVEHLTSQVRCPTCRSQSVADSDAPAAVAIRDEIRRRVGQGESDTAILNFLVDRFTEDVRLNPAAKGVGVLVWALPVLGVLVVSGCIAAVFLRRSRQRSAGATDADRELVERALRAR